MAAAGSWDRPAGAVCRRELLIGAAAVALFLQSCASDHTLSPEQLAELAKFLTGQVIPRTDTPGGVETGTATFLLHALQSGINGTKGDELTVLARELDRAASAPFMSLPPKRRAAVLARVDSESFDQKGPRADRIWPKIKMLILMGYYTSEAGASQELQYDLVPGTFRGILPFAPGSRAFSNDWPATGR